MGEKLQKLCDDFLPAEWKTDQEFLKRCLETVGEKIIKNPSDARAQLEFYFKKSVDVKPEIIANPKMKVDAQIAKTALTAAAQALEKFNNFADQQALKDCLTKVIAELGLKNGQVLWPIRVALTGEAFSPGAFEVLWALGKAKSLARLNEALAKTIN